jgi:hypothetical protein
MKVGEPFIPWKLFVGIYVPKALAQYTKLSQGAKLCYGLLCYFAGEDGQAWPSHNTLAAELGIKPRMVRNYLNELKEQELIDIIHTKTSNRYIFLWHELLEASIKTGNKATRQDAATSKNYTRQHIATPPGKILPPDLATYCHRKESLNRDIEKILDLPSPEQEKIYFENVKGILKK